MLFRRVLAYALKQFQGMAWYRKLMRSISPGFYIFEANAPDLSKVSGAFNLSVESFSSTPNPHVTNYVARRNQTIVGFAQLVRNPEENFPYVGHWLYGLQVLPRWRGFGIGADLTRKVMDQATREGAPDLFCLVFKDNRAALNLYGNLGFAPTIILALEELLEEEERTHGRRRVLLRKALS